MPQIVYADRHETILHEHPIQSSPARNHVLLGSWLRVGVDQGDWLHVEPRPNRGDGGWVNRSHVRSDPILKVFFVDVGQGDGIIIESKKGIILIDGGPNRNFYRFMRHRYKPIIEEEGHVHINAVVVTHPDDDHFHGLTQLLKDDEFTFGTIYHNGIIRYRSDAGKTHDLGTFCSRTINGKEVQVLTETFTSIDQAEALVDSGLLMSRFKDFWSAALDAHTDVRLARAKRITNRNHNLPGYSGWGGSPRIDILAPVPTRQTGRVEYIGFAKPGDSSSEVSKSHTLNGHSIVLKLTYGDHSFLFGGDLNIPAEKHLLDHYSSANPFRVDVAKACHHGSSDFSINYLKKVLPQVNVISSGEERRHDHPMPDAVGAMGRHTRGKFPLLFATELARTEGSSGTHYGLINARSNGTVLTMAQMKEKRTANVADVWHSFTVPWRGAFAESAE